MLLVHISDIHFDKEVVGSSMDPNAHIRNELLRDAGKMCRQLDRVPSAILVTGDLTYRGDSEEFEYAQQWLNQLCSECGTDLKSVFVVPGNHDVVRNIASRPLVRSIHESIKNADDLALDNTIRGFLTDSDGSRLLYEPLVNYNSFAGNFFCSLLPPDRTIAKRDLLMNDGSVLRLLGLNSTFVSSEADKEGELYVDPSALSVTRERGVEYMVLCHHPCHWLRRGDALRNHLNDIARIQLFGHEHSNRIELMRDWVRVFASAAHPERSEPDWEPGYNLIEVEVLGEGSSRILDIHTHVREWQQRPGLFRPKLDNNSEDVFHHSIGLETWVKPNNKPGTQSDDETRTPQIDTCATITNPADPMDSLRDISLNFFLLSLSQKSAIAGKLGLLEDEDTNEPDFERFRRVLIRARDKGLIKQLEQEINNCNQ